MTEKPITWVERVAILTKALGRKPTMAELLDVATIHQMTREERQAQAESFARAMKPLGEPHSTNHHL